MNLTELERKLLAAARAHPPSDGVPYAFEQRILARLPTRRPLDELALWARGLWRAALSCVAVTLLVSAFTLLVPVRAAGDGDLSDQFEHTVYAVLDQDGSW